MASMYNATAKLVTVGETPKSSDMGVRQGIMIAEPMGDAMAASPMIAVMNHFVDRGYWYGSETSGMMVRWARRPRRFRLGTLPGYFGLNLEEMREIWRERFSLGRIGSWLEERFASRSTSLPCSWFEWSIDIVVASECVLEGLLKSGDMSFFSDSSIVSSDYPSIHPEGMHELQYKACISPDVTYGNKLAHRKKNSGCTLKYRGKL